jgi:hypothetical protein
MNMMTPCATKARRKFGLAPKKEKAGDELEVHRQDENKADAKWS